jgi:hypothetical protein
MKLSGLAKRNSAGALKKNPQDEYSMENERKLNGESANGY